jgi:anti-sigma factor RsiW
MNDCANIRDRLHAYIDGELQPAEVLAVEAHLLDCRSCAAEYDVLRTVTDTVRGARPLYDVPPQLQADAVKMFARQGRVRRAVVRVLAAALAIGVCWSVFTVWRQRSESVQFTTFAAGTHRKFARSLLPLDLVTANADEVNRWLERRVPFHIVLPNYPAKDNTAKPYHLNGIRLVNYGSRDAAFVAYEMNGRPISLLIASADRVKPSGGETAMSGSLAFHFERHDGLQTIAWTDRGLTYALVSDIDAPPEKSCVVCHGSIEERSKFEDLRKDGSVR